MHLRKPALIALLLAAGSLHAAGDIERGRTIAAACSACHGPYGSSPSPAFPILGGQHAEYLVQALLAYQSGSRADSIMGGAVQTLNRQQLEDVAAYFAAQKGLAGKQPAAGGGMTASLSTVEMAGSLAGVRAPSPSPVELAACPGKGSRDRDRDGDGLADAFDAARRDAGECARDGDGDGWYGICSAEQLQAIQTLATGLDLATRNARRYELVQDLDLGTIANWTPVGNCGAGNNCMVARDKYGFAGALDGNGHTLRNLTINLPAASGSRRPARLLSPTR